MHLIRLEASPLPGMIPILISINILISASIPPQLAQTLLGGAIRSKTAVLV